ncbi:hypothetical protein PybrP1_000267 [[Pythium] brassicae (nom. inval.)]|nr:hypothetical protein PybrP1_000267 [[Pythium] brassicae (nom. inval.)]
MAGSASASTPARPRVAVLYTPASSASREGELSAKYLGLCLAASGHCEKVFVVGIDPSVEKSAASANAAASTAARRSDDLEITAAALGSALYEETRGPHALAQCHVWLLLLDADATANAVQFLLKRVKKSDATQPKRVIVSLQTTLRQLNQLDKGFVDCVVLHGGLGFQVVEGDRGVLAPLSHGCYFLERLPKEKVEALFVLDMLEATGLQVLSRRNIQALKWGTTMLRTFYYINALAGGSVASSLRDRNLRLLFTQALYEMSTLFENVMLSNASARRAGGGAQPTAASWLPDTIACTYVSVHMLTVLLPLPDALFRLVLRVVDFGLFSSPTAHSVTSRDLEAHLETSFAIEFKDVFELASNRSMALPALEFLQTTLAAAVQAKSGPPCIASGVMVANVALSPKSRAASRAFLLKALLLVLATALLGSYLVSR